MGVLVVAPAPKTELTYRDIDNRGQSVLRDLERAVSTANGEMKRTCMYPGAPHGQGVEGDGERA